MATWRMWPRPHSFLSWALLPDFKPKTVIPIFLFYYHGPCGFWSFYLKVSVNLVKSATSAQGLLLLLILRNSSAQPLVVLNLIGKCCLRGCSWAMSPFELPLICRITCRVAYIVLQILSTDNKAFRLFMYCKQKSCAVSCGLMQSFFILPVMMNILSIWWLPLADAIFSLSELMSVNYWLRNRV